MKGQLSIEYLSVISVFLLVFTGVSLSIMDTSLDNLTSVQYLAIWKANKVAVESAMQVIKFHPGTVKTVYIRVPPDCTVTTSPTRIVMNCPGNITDSIVAFGGITFDFPLGTPSSGELVPLKVIG